MYIPDGLTAAATSVPSIFILPLREVKGKSSSSLEEWSIVIADLDEPLFSRTVFTGAEA